MGVAHALCEDDQALEEMLAETIEAALGCAPRAAAQTKALLLATRSLTTEQLLDRGAYGFRRSRTWRRGHGGYASVHAKAQARVGPKPGKPEAR